MTAPERPQIYLLTPPEIELARFPDTLAAVLDAHEIGCLRLALATQDADRLARAADAVRAVAHARDVAVVIDSHVQLVTPLGLDGVHFHDGARQVKKARKDLGEDAVVGAYCGASRHEGMIAGENGADYVAFGPVKESPLGDGSVAPKDLFAWWSEMIELPIVAEGALDEDSVASLSQITDFFAIGAEIWGQDDPVAALGALIAKMG